MEPLKVAVLGATGIGTFHAREYKNAGAEVSAILGRTKESSERTASFLSREFGMSPKAYDDLDTLLHTESIQAVSVCTPPALHYGQVKKCLGAGLHVLCEKPFVGDSYVDNYGKAVELVELSKKQERVLTVNTQWPAILPYIKKYVDLSSLRSFAMHTEPVAKGVDMLVEQLSHQISLVVNLIPCGRTEDLKFIKDSDERIQVNFTYLNDTQVCDVEFLFTHKPGRPRKVVLSFDHLEFRREIGENYQQRFVVGDTAFTIEDPFKTSIGRFIGAAQGTRDPLVSKREIVENVALQDRIIRAYMQYA